MLPALQVFLWTLTWDCCVGQLAQAPFFPSLFSAFRPLLSAIINRTVGHLLIQKVGSGFHKERFSGCSVVVALESTPCMVMLSGPRALALVQLHLLDMRVPIFLQAGGCCCSRPHVHIQGRKRKQEFCWNLSSSRLLLLS